jgi:ERCC4-type nuclease
MCLLIDDREEPNLARLLQSFDLDVAITRLEYGDAMFEGCGPTGRPVTVSLERKHIADVIQSMTTRRLTGHQLKGMAALYDYRYLVIEDNWRPTDTGGIEIWRGRGWMPAFTNRRGITYRQVDSYLSSLELRAGLIVLRTSSIKETAFLYASRYQHWQKPWSDHHAHDSIYSPPPNAQYHRGKTFVATREAGLMELIAAQFPHIDRKAWVVGEHFDSVGAMILASEKEWQEIPGVGPITAHEIFAAIWAKQPRRKASA